MACVETAPIPESHKKVDELFLFWLSEPSTQEMLRKELSKVRRLYDLEETDASSSSTIDVQPTSCAPTAVHRSLSPLVRTPSPPPILSRSPNSPRAKPRPLSPRRTQPSAQKPRTPPSSSEGEEHPTASAVAGENGWEETDSGNLGIPNLAPDSREESVKRGESSANASAQCNEPDDAMSPVQPREMEQPVGASASPKTAPPEIIPQFYFPRGRPVPEEDTARQLQEVSKIFQSAGGELPLEEFHAVAKVRVCAMVP